MFEMGPRGVNADFDWDGFDPDAYYAHNYRRLRDDDRCIIELVRDHFSKAFEDRVPDRLLRGIDVGTGSNLYPALTMLPFCKELTLFERSQNNVMWLKRQQNEGIPMWGDSWLEFWQVMAKSSVYAEVEDPAKLLAERMDPLQGSVYELKADPPYGLGTMFFVAESITEEESEFRSGMDHFLDALAPGAPFAIAFMEHSSGYAVGGRRFPATDIDKVKVEQRLADRATDVRIEHVGTGDNPVRLGYTGMLIALGKVNGSSDEG